MQPSRSYVLACTPRAGGRLLSGALAATGIAGRPAEWVPRFTPEAAPTTPLDRIRLVTQPPPEAPYDVAADAAHIRNTLACGTSANGVFGVVMHWLVLQDAVRRLQAFLGTGESAPHHVLAAAFPNLAYVWLKRRDKVAQAVSWYRAVQTGEHLCAGGAEDDEDLHFDYAQIRSLLFALTTFENAQGSFFAANGLTPLVLYYEDLAAQHVSSVRSVLSFLQLDGDAVEVAPPERAKDADARSLAWIEQFRLLHKKARSTR